MPSMIESARLALAADCQSYINARTQATPASAGGFFHQLGMCLIAIVGGLLVGLVAGRLARTDTGRFMIRSAIRGFIYRAVGALHQ
jgi:hypothetical protein